MSIRFPCSGCFHTMRAPDEAAGEHGRCPKCGLTMTIPDPATRAHRLTPADLAAASGTYASPARRAGAGGTKRAVWWIPVIASVVVVIVVLVGIAGVQTGATPNPDAHPQAPPSASTASDGSRFESSPAVIPEPESPGPAAPAPREDPQPALAPGKEDKPELAADEKQQTSPMQDGGGPGTRSSPDTGGNKPVPVKGYFRSNGTYVPGHNRAAPGNGTSRGGFGGSARGGSVGG
jgi:hypothetical protein